MGEPTADEVALAGLREQFPGWEIWCVRCFDGNSSSVIWCARPPLVQAGSPEALAEALGAAG